LTQVIEIGEFRLKREQNWKREGCQHVRLTLEDEGEIVMCDDCGKQVGNYAALRMLVERWSKLQERVDAKQRSIAEAAEKTISLRAAQRVEKAWRSRSMTPTCPHCNEAIFPEDGFGGSAVNREIALRRREAKKNQHSGHAA